MDKARLRTLLDRFAGMHILVLGDFFLDRYLVLDPVLAERSLETGLVARQVVGIRNSPGAGGTVTNNLCALGAHVTALGVIGEDGMGNELLRALDGLGVDTSAMVVSTERYTPTYIKPMERISPDVERETERLDIKNRTPTPARLVEQVVDAFRRRAPDAQGIIIADQVPEEGCGTVTRQVRLAVDELSMSCPQQVIAVDSRNRVGAFQNQILKPNENEAWAAVHGAPPETPPSLEESAACGLTLHKRTGRPLFVTVGERGILSLAGGEVTHVPSVPVPGPIDIVGAGDSAMAALVLSLCAGASPPEAAQVANLVASITIQQLGTTGTATCDQVLARNQEAFE